MHISYTPRYYANIGDSHIFPIRKFEMVRNRLLSEETIDESDLVEPQPAAEKDVLLVHTEDYISRLCAGRLSAREIRRLGLPWSESLVQRSFYAVGGTIAAARYAIENGVGSNLAGGTHHSFADRGEGFCVLNDVAIAVRVLQRDGIIKRAAVVDCDVHQGNGTATIFADESNVFTFSMHGAKNYPLFKVQSRLDIELPDGLGDEEYLFELGQHLPTVLGQDSEVVFYLAGADPYSGDKLGRLALSIDGLRRRDELVLSSCFEAEIPVVTVMSGGYAEQITDTVEIHCNTIRAVRNVFGFQRQLVATRA